MVSSNKHEQHFRVQVQTNASEALSKVPWYRAHYVYELVVEFNKCIPWVYF